MESIFSWLHQIPESPADLTSTPSPDTNLKGSKPRKRRYRSIGSEHGHTLLSYFDGRKRGSLSLPLGILGGTNDRHRLRTVAEPPNSRGKGPSSNGKPSTSNKSKSSSTLNPRQSTDTRSLGDRMTAHGLVLNDDEAFTRYPRFQAQIYDIIDRTRSPDPAPSSERKLKTYLEEYGRASEATFLMHIMPILLKDGFFSKVLKPGMSEEEQEGVENMQAVFREFLIDEGIVINRDEELRGTLLPHRYMGQGFEEEMEKALKKSDRMRNAKPDYIFGITHKKIDISGPPVPSVIQNLLTIAPGIYHPFLIIEGKGDQGSQAQAEDQCRRGGATLVHAA